MGTVSSSGAGSEMWGRRREEPVKFSLLPPLALAERGPGGGTGAAARPCQLKCFLSSSWRAARGIDPMCNKLGPREPNDTTRNALRPNNSKPRG